ncbi:uncharacterized protein LOC114799730 isoform X2 [Denticeps clupeoides]|uniref:uncharacterized protein LOC114799730 isoform X2 n=1 Tax=Denticeps clupeoides TaxID=299321 RepID=UPI0010A34960|nr:uncharacterized protein LOC114799730 isoform X2 [Denticeps clupeoides]
MNADVSGGYRSKAETCVLLEAPETRLNKPASFKQLARPMPSKTSINASDVCPSRRLSAECNFFHLSPDLVRRRGLLKWGSPNSKALERLKQKIQKQKQERKVKSSETERHRRDHGTSKVCRVAVSPKESHCTYILAWRHAQRLVKEVLGPNKTPLTNQLEETSVPFTKIDQIRKSSKSLVEQGSQIHGSASWTKSQSLVKTTVDIQPYQKQTYTPPATKLSPTSRVKPHTSVSDRDNMFKVPNRKQTFFVKTKPRISNIPPSLIDLDMLAHAHVQENNTVIGRRPSRPKRYNVQEVRQYMERKMNEWRRKQHSLKIEAEEKEKKKKNIMQDVLRKQEAALQQHKKESRSARAPPRTSDAQSEAAGLLRLDYPARTNNLKGDQKPQLEDLSTTIVVQDKLTENEDINLGGPLQIVSVSSESFGLNNSSEHAQVTSPIERIVDGKGCSTITKRKEKIFDAVTPREQRCGSGRPLPERKISSASEQSDSSTSTESNSNWSELSEFYGQRQLYCHLSLAHVQQFLREEELRARQCSAIFRLREAAALEKTEAELQWLDHCERSLRSGNAEALADIRKKKENVVSQSLQEQAEIHHWRNMYKLGRHQRKLLSQHQKNILDIRKTAVRLKLAVQEQIAPDREKEQEGKFCAAKPGLITEIKGRNKRPTKEESFLNKAGLRRLLTSDDVWTFGRKRQSVDNQATLQTPEADEMTGPDPSITNPPSSTQNQPALHGMRDERHVEAEDENVPDSAVPARKAEPKLWEHKVEVIIPIHSNDKEKNPQYAQNTGSFTPPHKRSTSVSERIKLKQGPALSSDIKDDNDHLILGDNLKEMTVKPSYDLADLKTDCYTAKTGTETQNHIQINNNHDNRLTYDDRQKEKDATKTDPGVTCQVIWPNTQMCIPKPEKGGHVILDVRGGDMKLHKNQSSISSLSGTESLSFSSEDLLSSEDEKDVHNENRVTRSSGYALCGWEPTTVQYNENVTHSKDQIQLEPTLSEILSPVDEVLSYGSSELPPSVKGFLGSGSGSHSLPPAPPAYEIITWTSEEDLPAPPKELTICPVDDPSITSEKLPPLPSDLSKDTHFQDPQHVDKCDDNENTDLLAKDNQEDDCSEHISLLPENEKNISTDPLASFKIGDRVLVYRSKPGVLKYKGETTFASGVWAGVALDLRNGNHNGTFKGVQYFKCDENCGVLVKAEDVSYLHRDQGTDLDTGVDEDPFSDEEPPRGGQSKGQHPERKMKATEEKNQEPSRYGHPDPKHKDKDELQKDALQNYNTYKSSGSVSHQLSSSDLKKIEDKYRPFFIDQWQYDFQLKPPPKVHVQPHDCDILYRLIDAAVEALCLKDKGGELNNCEVPSYLADDESRRSYREVFFDLTRDILNDMLTGFLKTSDCCWTTTDTSPVSTLQSGRLTMTDIKTLVKKEVKKLLSLERTDQQMQDMLQGLCKYWYAKRDRVDHILIQELQNEEKQWTDYIKDQRAVKMKLTEDIFNYLLDDTISILNTI